MSEQTITAAAVITYCGTLEDGAARLYEDLAQRFPELAEALTRFAADCAKTKLHIVRTYQETITDAIEAGYAFGGLTLGDPLSGVALANDLTLSEALAQARAFEEAAAVFYGDIADRSQDLLATITGSFRRGARNHSQRAQRLEALLA